MKAIVKSGPKLGIDLVDFEEPQVADDEVLIKVKFASICGTDLTIYEWIPEVMSGYNINFPFIMGHEFSGEVCEVGSRVQGFKKGDRVTANPVLSCGRCFFCEEGRPSICDDRLTLGIGINGAFAEYVVVPFKNVYKLPERVSFEEGALIEPLCVAVHATEQVHIRCGDTVAIIGPGAVGLLMVLVAKASGASQIFIIGTNIDEQRLRIAIDLGANVAINIEKENPLKIIRDFTGGLGADVVFETSGSHSAVPQAINLARKGGKIGLIGLPHKFSEIETSHITLTEKELIGIRAYSRSTWKRSISLMANERINLKPLITHSLPLIEAEKGFNLMKEKKAIRTLLVP